MAGLGQIVSTTGRARARKLRDAVTDNHPLMAAMKDTGGIKREDGGRSVVEEAKMAQNSTVAWVGESGTVSLADTDVIDAAEFNWKYQLGSVTWTLAERYKNSGGSDTKLIDLIAGKFEVLEDSLMNLFHEGMLSDGTGSSGLQLLGLAALVSTTPTSGTVGGLDRSSSSNAWFRNLSATSTTAVGDASVDASNAKRFIDYGLNQTIRNSKITSTIGFLGSTHWEYLNQAVQAIQVIQNVSGTAKAGFDRIVYRGVPMYFGGGVSYSGLTQATATRTYLLCTKPGGVNLTFHQKAEFDMLEPVESADQAVISRLMFTMAAMTIGGLAKLNWVGYDG